MDEILWCYHSNETSSAVLSHGTIYLVCSSNFWVCGWNPLVLPFKWNIFGRTFAQYYLFLGILEIKTNSIKWRLFIGWTWTALLWLLIEEKGFVGHFIREIRVTFTANEKKKDSSWEFLRIENKDIKNFPNSRLPFGVNVNLRALTICMENPEIPGKIQMERFIPVEIFRK